MVHTYGSDERSTSMDVHHGDAEADCEGYPVAHDALAHSGVQTRGRAPFASVARLAQAGMALATVAVMGVALSGGSRHAAVMGTGELAAPPPTTGTGTGEEQRVSDTLVVPTDSSGTYDGAYVFKKTMASMDARRDGEFLVDALGFMTVSLACE